ncbi:hypothetical protein ES705_46333 [subsurface metagenome]
MRLNSRITDKRYGFIFQAHEKYHTYDSLHAIAKNLMDFKDEEKGIKVIDFSEVPSDILPVIVGLVARIIYQTQFWMDAEKSLIWGVRFSIRLRLPFTLTDLSIYSTSLSAFSKSSVFLK